MRASLINSDGEKTYAVVMDKGEEVMASLQRLALEHALAASQMTAIGAFSDVVLGYFDRERRDYKRIPVSEQVELLSLIGDVTLDGMQPKIHAHVVLGRADGSTCGGHLLEAHVWPTLEIIVTEAPRHLRRRTDPETGLALIDLRAA